MDGGREENDMRKLVMVVALALLLAACTTANTSDDGTTTGSADGTASASGSLSTPAGTPATAMSSSAGAATDPEMTESVMKVVNEMRESKHLRAVLVRVTVDGQVKVEQAVGESMTGVPATTDMHFRNGAVAESYMSTLLLMLVDEGKVTLDDKVSTWLPDLPHADQVTLGQLVQMTSGYVDFEQLPEFTAANYAQPFKMWTPEELLSYAVGKPLWYEPGTNWNYAHTNYVILGLALEKITGQGLNTALQEKVLKPLGLNDTTDPGGTAIIPEPVLHAFSSERRQFLSVPAGTPFYEESTFWNPSWTLAQGAIQTTTLHDLSVTAEAINSGRLLSAESYAAMVSTDLRGKTSSVPGCAECFEQIDGYTYGLGIVISGNWLLQDPLFSGESAVAAYLPSQKIGIAVAVTYEPEAFDGTTGAYDNVADQLWRQIGIQLAPTDPPPVK
jgi:CubicO group peptidase (beta-lactamase class C family)